jgi:hypothetical protein
MKDVQELTFIGEIQEEARAVPYFMCYNLSLEDGEARPPRSCVEKCCGDDDHFGLEHQ